MKINYASVKEIMKKAGIAKVETAKLFGVTRQTIHNWEQGKGALIPIVWKNAEMCASKVKAATEAELLPLGEDVPRGQRLSKIREAIRGGK